MAMFKNSYFTFMEYLRSPKDPSVNSSSLGIQNTLVEKFLWRNKIALPEIVRKISRINE